MRNLLLDLHNFTALHYIVYRAADHNTIQENIITISLHRDYTSSKTNCPWQANFYCVKRTNLICLTKFEPTHNHPCDTKTIDLAPKNLRFAQPILDKINIILQMDAWVLVNSITCLLKNFLNIILERKTCTMQFRNFGVLEFTMKRMLPLCFHIF